MSGSRYVTSPLENDENITDLIQWCNSLPNDCSVSVGLFGPENLRGLFATKPIQAGDTLCTLNESHILFAALVHPILETSVEKVKQVCPVDWAVVQVLPLALLILLETIEEDVVFHNFAENYIKSYSPYVNTLPKMSDFESSPNWTSEELELLKNTPLYSETTTRKQQTIEVFEILAKEFENVWEFSYDRFVWAINCCVSRQFGGFDSLNNISEVVLLPLIDMANNIEVNQDTLPFITVLQSAAGTFVHLVARRNYEENEEILISYGKNSSLRCMLDYGFLGDELYPDSLSLQVYKQDLDLDSCPNAIKKFNESLVQPAEAENESNKEAEPSPSSEFAEPSESSCSYEVMNFCFSRKTTNVAHLGPYATYNLYSCAVFLFQQYTHLLQLVDNYPIPKENYRSSLAKKYLQKQLQLSDEILLLLEGRWNECIAFAAVV